MGSSSGTLTLPKSERADGQALEDPWVRRFGLTERFAHWWTVSLFVAALLTGSAMGDEARSGTMLTAHVAAVVLLFVGVFAALMFGDHRALLRAARQLVSFDRTDVAWALARVRHPLRRSDEHRWGMFNTGQKLLAWSVGVAMAAVIGTGIQSWSAGGGDGGEGGAHSAAVTLASVLLGAHVFMAVVNPTTRPALAGMVFGRVRRSWAAKHHSKWLDDVEKRARQALRPPGVLRRYCGRACSAMTASENVGQAWAAHGPNGAPASATQARLRVGSTHRKLPD
jgi:formate dehydrogenase gamma subunit